MSTIEVNSRGHFVVVGEVTYQTVPQLFVRGKQLIAASPQPVFELNHVTASDNASVALLTSWARYAKQLQKHILYIELTEQLLDLVTACGLVDILPIRKNNE